MFHFELQDLKFGRIGEVAGISLEALKISFLRNGRFI